MEAMTSESSWQCVDIVTSVLLLVRLFVRLVERCVTRQDERKFQRRKRRADVVMGLKRYLSTSCVLPFLTWCSDSHNDQAD